MTNEIAPLTDPGLPEHVHRKADVDPKAAKKAERHKNSYARSRSYRLSKRTALQR